MKDDLTHHERRLLERIGSGVLRRQVDHTEEGVKNGGYMFWIDPGGKSAGPKSAAALIKKGCIKQIGDGLFDGCSQSFRV